MSKRSVEDQAINAIMQATDCTHIRAETALHRTGFVPDAIDMVNAELNREREREDARRRLTTYDLADRVDSLEEQVHELQEQVSQLFILVRGGTP